MLFDKTRQNIKNLNRSREIIQVLLKYGFEDIVINTPLSLLIPESRRLTWLRKTKPIFEYSRWERIRLVTEELGATYIKFAQVLSNRPDVLPYDLIKELEKLQSDVPPFDIAVARQIIEEETQHKIEDLFEYFLDKPIGSASIGQVHRAKFKKGAEVVVKVQRPNIRKVVETDLSIMHEIAQRVAGYLERQGITNVIQVVEAFEKTMQKELDYQIEARNMSQFRAFYKDKLAFGVPQVYSKYSTDKLIISDYISGCKITDSETIKSWGLNPKILAEKIINHYLAQIFQYGLFHADPHPGNVLVQKDGKICIIDYGMVGRLMKKDKFAFAGIFVGMAQRDARKIATSLRQLALEDNVVNKQQFIADINEILEDHLDVNLSDSSLAGVGNQLQRIIYKNRLQIPRSVFLILRTLAILEGIGKQINPNLNIYNLVKPYGALIIQDQVSTENLTEELLYRVVQFDSMARKLPNELSDVLRKTRKGELELNLNLLRYESLVKKADELVNRLILTFIIVALIIGSSLMFSSSSFSADVRTTEGYPYIAIVGFLFAGLLSFVLFLAMWRRDRK